MRRPSHNLALLTRTLLCVVLVVSLGAPRLASLSMPDGDRTARLLDVAPSAATIAGNRVGPRFDVARQRASADLLFVVVPAYRLQSRSVRVQALSSEARPLPFWHGQTHRGRSPPL